MALSNYPPGMRESDIPGNRPEDARFELWAESVNTELAAMGIDAYGADEHRIAGWIADFYNDNPPEQDEDGWYEPDPRRCAEIVREHLNGE